MAIKFIAAVATLFITVTLCQAAPKKRGLAQTPQISFTRTLNLSRFWRGNLHTHSNQSDGDSPSEVVVQWYKTHGYHFVAMTDHHRITSGIRNFTNLEVPGSFRVIRGEEATYDIHPIPQAAHIAIHANALCARTALPDPQINSATPRALVRPTLTRIMQDIRTTGATAQLNHPNLGDAFDASDILTAIPAEPALLLEIANQHPMVNNLGINAQGQHYRSSTEEIWDALLTAGRTVYGTATDDMHDLNWTVIVQDAHGTAPPLARYGGRGWVQVSTDNLEPQDLCNALVDGRFYASTGVELASIQVSAQDMGFEIRPASGETDSDYTTTFISNNNRISVGGLHPTYHLQGSELFVRAVIQGPQNRKAWGQPVFTQRQ